MQRRERQLYLLLDTLGAGHLEIGSRISGRLQQSALPDTWLTAHYEDSAPARTHVSDQPAHQRALQFSAP